MKKIIRERGKGKTTDLIKLSAETGYRIVTPFNPKYIQEKANEMNVNIPIPIDMKQLNSEQFKGETILIDEIESFISKKLNRNVYAVTLTEEDSEIDLSEKSTYDLNLNTLTKSLNILIEKHHKLINANDFNTALNVVKNIDYLQEQIKKIKELNKDKFKV